MNFKHNLFYLAITILLFEITCFILMPSVDAGYILNEEVQKGNYVPYMFAALTAGFISATIFLVSFIVFILKASIKENIPSSALLAIAFLFPVAVYLILT